MKAKVWRGTVAIADPEGIRYRSVQGITSHCQTSPPSLERPEGSEKAVLGSKKQGDTSQEAFGRGLWDATQAPTTSKTVDLCMSISGLNIPDQYSPTVYMVQYEFQTEHIQNEIQYPIIHNLGSDTTTCSST